MLINYLNKIKIMLFYLLYLKKSTSFRMSIKTCKNKKTAYLQAVREYLYYKMLIFDHSNSSKKFSRK